MKKIILATFMAVTVACNNKIENNNIPELVITTFQKKYPEATDIKWEELHGTYQVKFVEEEYNRKIIFNSNGSILIEAANPKNLIQ